MIDNTDRDDYSEPRFSGPDPFDRPDPETDALLTRELAGYYDSQDEDYPRDDDR